MIDWWWMKDWLIAENLIMNEHSDNPYLQCQWAQIHSFLFLSAYTCIPCRISRELYTENQLVPSD